MPDRKTTESRTEARSNVFLSAVLDTENGALPVRIRNMSSHGALLDGPDLPADGYIVLRRGNLQAQGEVAWCGDGYCGVRFPSEIDVKTWVKRVAHAGQERVDGIIAALRAGAIPHTNPGSNPSVSLDEIIRRLSDIADNLASMPDMTTEMGEQILKLEALAHTLQNYAKATKAA